MSEEMTDWLPDENGNPGTDHDGAGADSPSDVTSSGDDADLTVGEGPAIGELQAAADTFNAAFNTALYELESSRRHNGRLVARIGELDEAIGSLRGALDEEVSKGSRREEEFGREAEQFRQDIDALTAERDRLQQALGEQEAIAAERAGDVSRLTARVEELEAGLAEHLAASEQEKQAHAQEREGLAAELAALQARHGEAESELQARQAQLDERGNEIADLQGRLEAQAGELQDKSQALADSERQVGALRVRIDTQSEELREQSERHAGVCEEMNMQLTDTGRELEGLRAAHDELTAHVEKLESLNRALHESSVTQGAMHKQQVEKKDGEIVLLRSRLEEVSAKLKNRADRQVGMAPDQEQGLQAADVPGPVSGETAVQLEALQGQLADLEASLDAARAERENLETQLQDYEALQQEVVRLREVASAAEKQDERDDSDGELAALRAEVDSLRVALADAEHRCEELQTEVPAAAEMPVPVEAPAAADDAGEVVEAQPGRSVSPVSERSRFIADLDGLLAEREGSDSAGHNLMYILLDRFVQVRDEIGVMESEHVLDEVGEIIVSVCDEGDRVSRFGDCTFAVVCSGESLSDTERKAETIRATIESRIFEYGGRSVITTASIGLCSVRPGDDSARDVISRADLACEAARSYGGNQVLASSAVADGGRVDAGDNYEATIRAILEEGRARIYYQPISSLKEKLNNSYEILLRIVDENDSVILPGEFFAMAGKCGCATDIDRYVVENVMKMMAENRRQDMTLFIKLTGQTVADHSFPVWIMRKVKEYRVNAEQLVFEIPEAVLQGDVKNLSMLARALNAIGCGMAIEHYRLATQLTHLMHIRAQYLKIDGSLVQSIGRKGESLSKVSAIMKMARQNNCVTIAEGVETSASLAILCELGVDMAQGYYIQAPSGNRDFDFHGEDVSGEPPTSGKATFTIG